MSSELERIDEQLRRSFEGEAWHGPAVLEALAGLTHDEAAARPIAGAHSIWELLLHLTSDYRLVLRRLGGDGRKLTAEEEWPSPPPATQAAWTETVELLRQLNQDLRRAVRGFSSERLDNRLVPEVPYTAYTQFIGITQHGLYHAGQVAILRRALVAARATTVVNRSAPRATVVPILVYEDVGKAIDWLCGTFGFRERLRAGAPGGSIAHAQLDIGEGAIMLGRQGAEFRPPRPNEVSQYVTVHVENVDTHFERAQQSGARILKSPADMPFGERQYTVEDLGGHRWTFSQSIADVPFEAWGAMPAKPSAEPSG